MTDSTVLAYWEKENLGKYFLDTKNDEAISMDKDDLVRLHRLIRQRMSFTVMELGVGFSTLIIADALKKNKADWEALDNPPKIRNRFIFQCFSVDTSEKWIKVAKERMPKDLQSFVQFQFSPVKIGTHNGQICHFYSCLPDVVPDFIYLDGPDPKAVEGNINGMTFQCSERTVMSGDLLLMEPILLPGTFVLVDGRTNNVRFLENNLKRNYEVIWNKKGDVTTFELQEERLGKYNLLGSDFIKNEY